MPIRCKPGLECVAGTVRMSSVEEVYMNFVRPGFTLLSVVEFCADFVYCNRCLAVSHYGIALQLCQLSLR